MAGISGARAVNAARPLTAEGPCDLNTHSGKQKHFAEQRGFGDNRQHLAAKLHQRDNSQRVAAIREIWKMMLDCRRSGDDPSHPVSAVIREVCVGEGRGDVLDPLSSIPQKQSTDVQYFWRWIGRTF